MKNKLFTKQMFLLVGSIAIPVILEASLHMAIGWIDTIMISRRLGGISFAGANTVNHLIGILTLVLMILATGSGILVAQYIGAKNKAKASEVAEQSLLFVIGLSIIIAIPLLLFGKTLLDLFPIEEKLIIYEGEKYLRYIVWFLPIQASLMLISGAIKSTGDTKSPMYAMVGVNLLNTGLNFLFLYVFNLGIEGPAIASGISRTFGLLLLIRVIKKENCALVIRFKNLLKVKTKTIIEVAKIGLPAAIENLSYRGSMFLLQLIIMSLGANVQIAAGFAGQVEQISFVPVFGLSMAVSILVGQKVGGQDILMAKSISKFTVILSTFFMTIAGVFFFIFGSDLLSFFTTESAFIKQGAIILYMLALAQPAKAINMSLNGTFRGAGNTLWVMYVTIIGNWTFCVGLGYYLGIVKSYGIYGVWFAIILDEWSRALINIVYYQRGNWVKSIIKKEEVATSSGA